MKVSYSAFYPLIIFSYYYMKTFNSPQIFNIFLTFNFNEIIQYNFNFLGDQRENEKYILEKQEKEAPLCKYTVSIPKFQKETEAQLKILHDKALKCLKDSNSPYGYEDVPFDGDMNARRKHYEWLKKVTEQYRIQPNFCWEGYCGEWIEDIWCRVFIDKDIEEFGPFIPIFIKWERNLVNRTSSDYKNFLRNVSNLLQPNYIYITVVKSSWGIEGQKEIIKNFKIPPNLIILTPGSRGHVPIPHLLRIKEPRELQPYKYEASFIGFPKYAIRNKVKAFFQKNLGDKFYFSPREKNWDTINSASKVVLSPRGFGRGCYRTYEMLQQGYVVGLIFDDYYWIPYLNSSLPWDKIAIIGKGDNLEEIQAKILSMDENQREEMHKNVLKYRHYFTYQGVIEQIALFMHGEGDLRCDQYHVKI